MKNYFHKYIDNEVVRHKYCELGMPTTLIAKEYGVSPSTISYRLDDMGVEKRDAKHALKMEWLEDNVLDRYNVDEEWLRLEYVHKGKPMDELAQIAGCSIGVIKQRLVRFGIKVRTMWESKKGRRITEAGRQAMAQKMALHPKKSKFDITYDDLYNKYIDLGMSCGDIAKDYGCVNGWIGKILKKYNIPMRDTIERQNMPRRLEKTTKSSDQYSNRQDVILDVLPSNPIVGTLIDGILAGYKSHGTCVWTICPECGEAKWRKVNNVRREKYGGLCARCVRNHPEYQKTMSVSIYKRFEKPEERLRLAESKKLFLENHPEYREERSRKAKLEYSTDEAKKMMKERTNKYWNDPIHSEERKKQQGARLSNNLVKWWANPEFKDAHVKRTRKACNIRPNKTETAMMELLDELYPNEWKYVGDGEVVLGGKNPDFINCNGRKAIIEVNGDYWHSLESRGECPLLHEIERIDNYSKYGYFTLVVWGSEFKNKSNIIKKLKGFYEKMDMSQHAESIL